MNVFKPYEQRLNADKFIESDADEQLLLVIPFTGSVKLKSIIVKGPAGEAHPSKMKAFTNRDDIDFDNVEQLPAQQEWELTEDTAAAIEYPTRYVLWMKNSFGC